MGYGSRAGKSRGCWQRNEKSRLSRRLARQPLEQLPGCHDGFVQTVQVDFFPSHVLQFHDELGEGNRGNVQPAAKQDIRRLNGRSNEFEKVFWSGNSLDDLYDRISQQPRDPMSAIFAAAMREWRRSPTSHGSGAAAGLAARIDRVMQITMAREMDRAERYMTFLATTGATAPFVGLFGTVWGIMASFQSIAISKNTSLAVVAPGIAEALFATALGLLAAIPAVIAYNKLSRDLDRYAGRLESFSGEFGAILSRELDTGE